MKKIKCTSNNSKWALPLENATIDIKSPKGGIITIKKRFMRFLTTPQRELILRAIKNESTQNKCNLIEYTVEEMKLLFNIAKL